MTHRDYEYRGMIAAAWDLLRGDTSNWSDRFFYKEIVAQSGQPVLDVGCGTGRILLDFLAAGIDIDGVDNSPEMLALCRQKAGKLGLRPALFQQDMETLDIPRRYRTILVPSSSFQLVTDLQDAVATMARLHSHLEPGGTLAMPFMLIWTGDPAAQTVAEDWQPVREKTRPEDGATIRRWSRSTYDVPNQLEHTEDRYEVLVGGQVIASEEHKRSPATRWYTQDQAVQLYRDAGLSNIRVLHDFTFEPATATDELFCVVAS